MTIIPTVTQMIDNYPDLSAQELADLWLIKLGVREESRQVLIGACANEVRLRRRERDRAAERAVLGHLPPREGTPVDQESLKRFLDRNLEIRPGEVVRMGDATKADWQARKEFLDSGIVGIRKSIERCEMAIQTLEHYKVDRLRDIPTDDLTSYFYIETG